MARVYVFASDNKDYSTVGECGSLRPSSCLFEEAANGMSEITMEHPLDKLGKYRFLQRDAILKTKVPVRTTPEIDNGKYVTQVESWIVKDTATKQERTVYSKKENGSKIKVLKPGTYVTVTLKPEYSERWKIKSGKTSGWISPDGLEQSVRIDIPENATGMEEAAPAWECREQLFRIYKTTKSGDGITCYARHISYDLMYNLTRFDTSEPTNLMDTLEGIMQECMDPHDFAARTDIAADRTGAHYADMDPISAILDPEIGLAAEYRAQFVRDNFELFLLQKAGANRGMRIAYGKNMLGVSYDESTDNVATAIRPIGEKKNGKPLYLEGSGLIISPHAEQYPFKRIYPLYCTDCKVGTNDVTTEIARKRMEEQALAAFENGADLPEISVAVTFAALGAGKRYRAIQGLENAFLFDEIQTQHPRLGINITMEVVRIIWDCLREKMNTTELGSLKAMEPSVSGWQISGGISGGKIMQETIGSAQLANDIINVRHMQAESINTQALQAESVTAEKLAAGSVTAEKIEAGVIDTESLKAITAYIESLTADSIATDRLAAALAAFTVITAGTAEFDQATIQHLVANALNLEFGSLDEVFINNLRVKYAQMVGAAIGNLVIGSSDGGYYRIDVDENGNVTATPVTVTDGEISAGQTEDGRVILATDITSDSLNTTNILATYALINRIDAARIDVNELFAREAFISMLRTTKIVSDTNIDMIIGAQNEMNRWFIFDDEDGFTIRKPAWSDKQGIERPESVWQFTAKETGIQIRRNDMPNRPILRAERDLVAAPKMQIGNAVIKGTSTGGFVIQCNK